MESSIDSQIRKWTHPTTTDVLSFGLLFDDDVQILKNEFKVKILTKRSVSIN